MKKVGRTQKVRRREDDDGDGVALVKHKDSPPLEAGPLPTLIYFSLSAEESLYLDPYNQPVASLSHEPMRIFSIDLPCHEPGADRKTAVDRWSKDTLLSFFDKALADIEKLLPSCSRAALAGLSRGAFIACHLASHLTIDTVLGFAPMTRFPGLDCHDLDLTDKKIRFYIGNNDTRVGTENAFEMITSFAKRVKREPPFELYITPSIGLDGHGTSKETFLDGAKWVKSCIL